ncbi:MAG TPA: hypothetical protein VFL80_12905 [Thermoanaerobaculia bacterium]|nr:hypothetical protein [Thermoanaerobaculia bacterium]
MEKPLEILDLSEELRVLVGACEVSGGRTLFARGERVVATLISWDEYLALRETVALSNDSDIGAAIAAADEQGRTGNILLPEDLLEEEARNSPEATDEPPPMTDNARPTTGFSGNDRLRIAERVAGEWRSLAEHEQQLVHAALAAIDDDPIAGVPLLEPLRGLWSYRTGHLRILYRIVSEGRFALILLLSRAAPV